MASKSVRWRPLLFILVNVLFCIFLPSIERCDTRLLEPDTISHTQSMVANRGQTLIPRCEKFVLQNANRSTNSGCNWTSFHCQQKKTRVRGDERGDQKPDTFLGLRIYFYPDWNSILPMKIQKAPNCIEQYKTAYFENS